MTDKRVEALEAAARLARGHRYSAETLVAERDAECELARLREQVDTLTRLVVRAARELPAGAAKANVLEDLLAEFPEAWRLLREHEAPATVRANGPRASARNRARMGRPVDLRSTLRPVGIITRAGRGLTPAAQRFADQLRLTAADLGLPA